MIVLATTYEELYKRFLNKVDDYDLLKLGEVSEQDLKDVLEGYLDSAIVYFSQCKKDLDTKVFVDSLGNIVNPDDINNVEDTVSEEDNTIVSDNVENTESVDNTENIENVETVENIDDTNDGTENANSEDSNDKPVIFEAFKDDLTRQEKEILTTAMVIAWLEPKLMSIELMNKDIGDRDYKSIQGHPYLKEINALKTDLEKKVRTYGVQYTYNNFSLEDW